MIYIIYDAELSTMNKIKASHYSEAVTKYLKWRGDSLPAPITTVAEAKAISDDIGLVVVEEDSITTYS